MRYKLKLWVRDSITSAPTSPIRSKRLKLSTLSTRIIYIAKVTIHAILQSPGRTMKDSSPPSSLAKYA